MPDRVHVRRRVVMFRASSGGPFPSTWTLDYTELAAGEVCRSELDHDGDGSTGCADDECWGVCTPTCAPTALPASCLGGPSCGDGVCTEVEDCRTCAADCAAGSAACPIMCGDYQCDASETLASCPGDCT